MTPAAAHSRAPTSPIEATTASQRRPQPELRDDIGGQLATAEDAVDAIRAALDGRRSDLDAWEAISRSTGLAD